MEFLKGSLEEVSAVKKQIEDGLGMNDSSVIKSYADIIQGKDECALPIIPEVKQYLTSEQRDRLVNELSDDWYVNG